MASISQGHLYLPADAQAAIQRGDTLGTGIVMLEAGLGMRALLTIDKDPIGRLTPHGVKDATDDPVVLKQWWMLWPDSELALVLGDHFGAVDVDQPVVDSGAWGVPRGTWTERTESGLHELVSLSRPARRCKLPGKVGDFITGAGSSLVVAPSPNRWPVEVDAPILALPDDAVLWETIQPKSVEPALATGRITPANRKEAEAILARLQRGMYGAGIRALFDGQWRREHPGWSESERDYCLVLAATHHTDDPATLAAILTSTGWPSDPHREHPKRDPTGYTYLTITAALSERHRRHKVRLTAIASCIRAGLSSPVFASLPTGHNIFSNASPPTSVFDAKFCIVKEVTNEIGGDIRTAILAFAAGVEPGSDWAGEGGWVRIPVLDIAEIFGRSRECVHLNVVGLENANQIERRIDRYRHDGAIRADSWIRLLPA